MLQPKLLWCYEGAPGAGTRPRLTSERHLYAWWLQKGSVLLRQGSRVHRASAGDWVLGGPQQLLQQFSERARILSINFRLEWPSGDSLVDHLLIVKAADHPALEKSARRLLTAVRKHFPGVKTRLWQSDIGLVPFFELHRHFSAWLEAYLDVALKSGSAPARMTGLDPRVAQAVRELNRHNWGARLSEKILARRVGLSVGHLNRLFVRDLKITPGLYLQNRRYESARDALSDSTASIKRISYNLGFSSPGHFTFWFRQRSGLSPLAFRKGSLSPVSRQLETK